MEREQPRRTVDWDWEDYWQQEMNNYRDRHMATLRTDRFTYERFLEVAGDNSDIVIFQDQLSQLMRDLGNRPHLPAQVREDLGPDDGVWIDGVNVHVEQDLQVREGPPENLFRGVAAAAETNAAIPEGGISPNAFHTDHLQRMRAQLQGEPRNAVYPQPLRFNTRDDQFEANRYGGIGINPIEQPVETPVLQLDARMLTRDEVRSNIDFRSVRHDYDTYVAITGTMRLRLAVQSLLDRDRETIQEEIMRDQLTDAFMARLNRGHGRVDYRGIDDELRDFIFFLHKNIAPEFRVEADEKFNEMRDSIWPDAAGTSPILPEEFE